MFPFVVAAYVILLCVGCACNKQMVRDLFYPVWMISLLLYDIFKDRVTDFWKNKHEPVTLPGDVAVVTGGARGIGVDIVKKLMESGMMVIVGCRNTAVGGKVLHQIRASGVTTGELTSYKLDLTSLASVQEFADTVLRNHEHIHILVNNAGITTPTRKLTDYGVESTFGVNYLAHCYLTHLLLPRLAESGRTRGSNARVVNVSSCVHAYPLLGGLHLQDLSLRDNFHEYAAYGQSKIAQVMFTKTLDAKMRSSGIPVQVHSVHPGVVHTYIMSQNLIGFLLPWLFPLILRTSEEGARSVFYASVSPQLESRGGTYISSSEVTETGGVSNSEDALKELWTKTKSLLYLDEFGGIVQ